MVGNPSIQLRPTFTILALHATLLSAPCNTIAVDAGRAGSGGDSSTDLFGGKKQIVRQVIPVEVQD